MENFEVFSFSEVKDFIENHKEFIDNHQSLFNPDYRTLKPVNKEVFSFIKCIFPNCPNKISNEIFNKFSKSLNKVRTEVKKEKRKKISDETEDVDLVGKLFGMVYQNYNTYLVIKVIKQTKCFVNFVVAEETTNIYNIGNLKYMVELENNEIKWEKMERKMKKEIFIKDNLTKEVDIDKAKTISRMIYID